MNYSDFLPKTRFSHILIALFIITSLFSFWQFFKLQSIKNLLVKKESRVASSNISAFYPQNVLGVETITTPSPKLTITPTPTEPWGVAKKVDEKTWTIRVLDDEKMANSKEIFDALNNYRKQKGGSELSWDEKLAEFALKRAEVFASTGGLDGHAGFNNYFKDEKNIKQIGFSSVGENSSYGYKMEAVHLIEWIFAADPPHEENQLDSSWTHVGVGVAGTGVDLIFGKK